MELTKEKKEEQEKDSKLDGDKSHSRDINKGN